MPLLQRIDRPELMDTQPFDEKITRRTLRFLGMTARRFGGAALVVRHLDRLVAGVPSTEEISILDVGCGGGEIPLAVAGWARARGRAVRIVAIDLVPEIAAVAREACAGHPEIEVREQNVFDLAGGGETFDVVTASLLLHHVPPPDALGTLRAFDRLARRGVIISDLRRSVASFMAVTAVSWLAGNHVVRHDGPLSVRRAFLPEELDALAQRAGLPYLRARREPFFRLSLAGKKG